MFYGIYSKKIKENIVYYVTRTQAFFKAVLPQKRENREHNKFVYESQYKNPYNLNNRNNSIPEGKYCCPFAIITSDLILREDIPKLQSGVSKLVKYLYTHKFLGAMHSIEEIETNIAQMDSILGSWYSLISVGRFDFSTHKILNNYIDYFDVCIRNVNSSYLALEFQIYLSNKFVVKQASLINSHYQEKRGYIVQSLMQNEKHKSGLKKMASVCKYNNSILKSDKLFENTTMLEWMFYNEMSKFFPLFFHNKKIIPPVLSLYKTNISYKEEGTEYFWKSVGVNKYRGQFFNENEKIFFKTDLTKRYEDISTGNYIYVVNDKNIECNRGYGVKDFGFMMELASNLDGVTFLFEFLNCMNTYASKEIIKYRSKLNIIKLKKNKLSKLLKTRYKYEKALDCFKRFTSDEIWEFACEQAEDIFDSNCVGGYDYKYITDFALVHKERIKEQAILLEKEFETKINILQHLNAYKNESKNRVLNIIMLFLTLLTVIFIIFPDWGEAVGKLLEGWYDTIFHFIMNSII